LAEVNATAFKKANAKAGEWISVKCGPHSPFESYKYRRTNKVNDLGEEIWDVQVRLIEPAQYIKFTVDVK
jgi:hypothetical protein